MQIITESPSSQQVAHNERVLVLPEWRWTARAAAHERRVDAWVRPHLDRRRSGQPHPVEDFLFEYYSHRPGQLRRWHPGPDVMLEGAAADPYAAVSGYARSARGVGLDASLVRQKTLDSAAWIRDLLAATAGRSAFLGCFGLHEWAMVYRAAPDEVRHGQWPLRLAPGEIAGLVDSQRVRCSHFDAFRFFTEPARPHNELEPTRSRQAELEQPGCLHANMDLYKWAYKLDPYVPSELVADAFELARDIRELDMRAAPYDLSALGYEPVAIETAPGRADYVAAQREFAARASVVRRRLIDAIEELLGWAALASAGAG